MSFTNTDKTDGLDRSEIVDTILSATETTLTATTTAQVAKVGGSNLVNRKYVFIEALDNNVKWGFTTACLFNAFRNSAIWVPASESQNVYIKTTGGSVSVVVAEGA